MKFKSKGFTLIETLLVIAVISIASIKIYTNYREQIISDTADRQALYIKKLIYDASSMAIQVTTGSANLATNIATITNSTTSAGLINAGIVPPEMINGATISNLWGGNFNISGVNVGGLPGLQVFLNSLPPEACVRLASADDVVSTSQSITANGTIVKNVNSGIIDSAAATNACTAATNTLVITADLVHPMKYPGLNDGTPPPAGPNYIRNKESRYNVAPTSLYTTSVAPSCPAGSFWDPVLTVCSCAAGTQWVGDGSGIACRTENSSANGFAGLCPLGWGWDVMTNTCQALPTRAGQWINNPWMGWVYSNVPTTAATRYGNRMVPNHIGVNPYIVPWGVSGGNAAQCAATPNGRWDGAVCQVCVRGTWQADRCVTP